MKILYVMPFKINATKWHLTGDSNMASQILKSLKAFPDLTIDVVGNFLDSNGVDCSTTIKETYGVNECIDLSSIASKRTYIKSGFEKLKSMDIFRNYDLINIHNSNPSIVSKLVTYLSGSKVIFTLHAPPENMTFQFYHRDQYLDFLNNKDNMLLCVSHSHAERCLAALNYFKDFPEGKPNIYYILNGISTNQHCEPLEYDCGTIGRFSPSKNVLESLKCVESITRSTGGKGFFVGTTSNYEESSESQKRYVDAIMNVLKDNTQIEWYESLTSEEVHKLVSKSKSYISLSTIETFGLTVCESLMQGTPCIGFDQNGIGEIIEEGVTGYKFSTSRCKWESRYIEVLDLYNKCLELDRDSIRLKAVERFNIDRVSTEYYLLYKDFIAR